MRIIVEGPDGAGKTHLVNKLVSRYGLPIGRRSASSEDGPVVPLGEYTHQDLCDHTTRINDRHCLISEPIYAAALGRSMDEAFNNVRWLAGALQQFYSGQPVIIYCLPPWECVIANVTGSHGGTDHMNMVVQHTDRIYQMYIVQAARDLARPRVFLHDYTKPDSYDMITWYLDGSRIVQ